MVRGVCCSRRKRPCLSNFPSISLLVPTSTAENGAHPEVGADSEVRVCFSWAALDIEGATGKRRFSACLNRQTLFSDLCFLVILADVDFHPVHPLPSSVVCVPKSQDKL